jgi:hypothetical protein
MVLRRRISKELSLPDVVLDNPLGARGWNGSSGRELWFFLQFFRA